MRLLIAIPSLDYVHYEFMKCLLALTMRLKDNHVSFDVQIEGGTLVYVARDKLANRAINDGYTHVLWLDADMIFTPDLVDDLMFSGKDFVSGICHARRAPHFSCLFKSIDLAHLERYEDDEYPKDTFEIGGCGFGCVFMNVDVLKAVNHSCGACFLPMKDYGEDIAFCKRAKDIGIKIYAEPSVRLGHIGHVTIYPEDRTFWKQRNNYPEDVY